MKKPVMSSAQAFLAHQKKWKETLIKQAQKTMAERINRENHLKKKEAKEG